MNKKLLAVAVAGAFAAAPLAAFAQSTVTISGLFKTSIENISIHNAVAARAGQNTSEGRLADDSSRFVFNVVEDLGGGMRAVAQADLRFNVGNQTTGNPAFSGNSHVGLRGNWGQIRAGQQDLHYGLRESYLTDKGDLRADSISILAFAAGGAQSIANATRTPSTVFYDTPELWGGLNARAAYSFSPAAGQASGDIGSTTRKGRAYNLSPYWSANGLNLGYSYWNAKFDNPNAAASANAGADQTSNRLAGSYLFSFGLRIGLAYDQSKLKASQTTVPATLGTTISKRSAWSFPVSYAWGPYEIHAHYDVAGNDKGTMGQVAGTNFKAKMFAISGQYNLSKRTSVALNYAQINNQTSASYNFFTSTSLGSGDAGIKAGEDPRLWSLTVRHAF